MPVRLLIGALLLLVALTACAGGDAGAGRADVAGAAEPDAFVVAVTDGDTVRLRIRGAEERVRLIGIDTPETHGPGGLRECFGEEASARLRELLPAGTGVRLVLDVEARDRYGRLLAYLYRADDGLFVNLAMARDGFAATLTIPPNVAHADAFATAAGEARRRGAGLWGRCGSADVELPPARAPART